MNLSYQRTGAGFFLVFLLLCSVCVAPAMAVTRTEDVVDGGVHVLKSSDSPTVLNPHIYSRFVDEDFVVDGDQYYWVRIGSDSAGTLSTHELASLVCYGAFLGVAGVADGIIAFVAFPPAATAAPPTLGGSIVLYYVGVGVAAAAVDGAIGWTATKVCPIVEKEFVSKNYRVVASDGTILLVMKRTNTAGIQELKKAGLDIGKLTHLTKEGGMKVDL
jgi:hypothetical protein